MTKILQNLTKESTVLHCNAMSATAEIDPIVLKWMKNGEILNEDVRYQLSKDKKTLHIYNFNSDDYGCYTCVVENSEGIAVANFLLPYASSDNHLSTGVLRSVLIAIAAFVGILLLGVTAIFIYKRIFIPTKNKDLAVRFKLHRTSNLYLQHDSTGPITEEPEYSYVEIQTERTDIDSVENKTQIQDVDVCTENNYSILGKCSTSPLDFTESNLYDHSENVSGIYSRTYKRRDDNQMIDSE
ncbi:uncharacterized protein LOC134230771 [Saccostrea cucullata]|uniref:uncharacterized protein LOC134230771 n=1 Tax=Saccostrea cuccullata TaxID=36930 RepID=UPI002ED04C45